MESRGDTGMSEEKAPYSAGDQLTFHGLVNDLEKLRSMQEETQKLLLKLERAYPSLKQDARFQQMDEHIIQVLAHSDDIIREYQRRNEKAEEITQYNAEMDERSRIILDSRPYPWLPYHDGE
jgi:RNA processing factor Prp31